MSNIKDLKKKLRYVIHDPSEGIVQSVTPFIWGKPGIGKSQAVKQIADSMGIQFIDLRLSQLESADLRGIPVPDTEQGISKWYPPEFLPFKGINLYENTSGILLLDELNRARQDVLQAAFQLVLDRRVGMHELLDTWYIVAAGNLGEEDKTDVAELDSALKNRFIHFYVDVDIKTWIDWAEKNEIHPDVREFLSGKPRYLYEVAKQDDNLFVTPRSWEKFSDILNQNPDVDPMEITMTLGPDILYIAAGEFRKFLEQKEIISGKDVVSNYQKVKTKVQKMPRDQVYSLNTDVVEYILKLKNYKDYHVENIHDFAKENLEDDIYIAFMQNLTKKCTENDRDFIDKYLDKYKEEAKEIVEILSKK